MIFLTVGHQLPFDRLVRLTDAWAAARGRSDIFAQIGESQLRPRSFEFAKVLGPEDFRRRIREASAVVAHAGVGTILNTFELDRPLLVLPRLVRHGEVSSDHQIPTAKHYEARGWLLAAYEDEELATKLDVVEAFRPTSRIPKEASPELIARIRGFVFGAR